MGDGPSREELEALHCWENDDHVSGSTMTAFRRTVRLHQARWREAHGHPIGSQPIAPGRGKPSRPVGSRLPLDYARETAASFLTAGAREAVRARMSVVEPHQTVDHQRLWAELLWSPALAFNLFGDLAADLALADEAVRAWWPGAPGSVSEVRFAHSPGRLDPGFLNSLRAFDAVFVLHLDDGSQGIVCVDVKYHEWAKPEIPRPGNVARYVEVAERSGAFATGAIDEMKGRSGLATLWLEHLLLLSMLQHASNTWSWGRYVVVHPAGNTDYAGGCERYRGLLANDSTFSSMTLEGLLDASAIPARSTAALRERYLPD
jgi:hypothetical protein